MTKPDGEKPAGKPGPNVPRKPESLEEAIERQIGSIIPQQARSQVVKRVVSVVRSEQFSGPIPRPDHFKEYDDALPGAAERILAMAESEMAHNQAMEARVFDAEIADRKLGMHYGFATVIVIVVLAFISGIAGNNTLAGILIGAGVIAGAGVFIKGRHSK